MRFSPRLLVCVNDEQVSYARSVKPQSHLRGLTYGWAVAAFLLSVEVDVEELPALSVFFDFEPDLADP